MTNTTARSRWLIVLAGGYSLLVIGIELARLTALQRWPTVQLISVIGPWIYLPLPLLAGLTLWRRRRVLLLALAVPLLGFGTVYGSLLLPKQQSSQPGSLRVMNWNVFYTNSDVAAVSAIVRAENPDVLTVQELGFVMSELLARELRDVYPHQLLYPHHNPSGFGIFSKLPMSEIHGPQLGSDQCRCHTAQLIFKGQPVTVVNTHPHTPKLTLARYIPGLSTRQQDTTLTILADQARVWSEAGPLLLVGDLNTSDQQPNYKILLNQLGDTFAEAGWGFGFTYPAAGKLVFVPGIPVVRIDYILHSRHWSASGAWTGGHQSSDHRYLVADLQLR